MSESRPKNAFQDALDRGAQPTAYHALKGVVGTAAPRRTLDEAYKLLGPNSSLPDRERLAGGDDSAERGNGGGIKACPTGQCPHGLHDGDGRTEEVFCCEDDCDCHGWPPRNDARAVDQAPPGTHAHCPSGASCTTYRDCAERGCQRLSTEKRPPNEPLADAVKDVCWKATPCGDDGEWVTHYLLPAGPIHRLVGAAAQVGITAPLRNPNVEVPPEQTKSPKKKPELGPLQPRPFFQCTCGHPGRGCVCRSGY